MNLDINNIGPQIQNVLSDYKERNSLIELPFNLNYHIFNQTWSSSYKGIVYEGMVCMQAFFSDWVIVLNHGTNYQIYFGGKFAYEINNPNMKFTYDLANCCLADNVDFEIYL